ncbi:hypothetical protein [Roseitalea sp. MMSF_3546]|nr:hypothetical protein [Roseitalea sp. MMSF_3546]
MARVLSLLPAVPGRSAKTMVRAVVQAGSVQVSVPSCPPLPRTGLRRVIAPGPLAEAGGGRTALLAAAMSAICQAATGAGAVRD